MFIKFTIKKVTGTYYRPVVLNLFGPVAPTEPLTLPQSLSFDIKRSWILFFPRYFCQMFTLMKVSPFVPLPYTILLNFQLSDLVFTIKVQQTAKHNLAVNQRHNQI